MTGILSDTLRPKIEIRGRPIISDDCIGVSNRAQHAGMGVIREVSTATPNRKLPLSPENVLRAIGEKKKSAS